MAVTRNDVAKQAGVSPGVVSYVLNNGPRPVSRATRQRVLDAVQELGYRPDGLARSLRMGRTETLGLVVPDASNPFFAELSRAIEDAAFARGYAVMVCNSADDPERENAYIRRLAERRVDGLIIVSAAPDQDLADATELAIPVVALDRAPDESLVSTIRSDNEEGAYLGARHLLDHGHQRIGFVGGPNLGVSGARWAGWRRALSEAGLPDTSQCTAPFTYAGGYEAAGRLFPPDRADVPPSAILVSSDIQALGLISGLDALRLSVPGNVAVIGFDGTIAAQFSRPPLTTVAQAITEMGSEAVARLVDRPGEIVHQALATTLVIRRSCGCPSASLP